MTSAPAPEKPAAPLPPSPACLGLLQRASRIASSRRASGCLGCSRRGGLSSAVSVVVGETWIPALEQRPERAVKRPRARLQQQVGAALGPLHLLTLSKALADYGVDCRFGQA